MAINKTFISDADENAFLHKLTNAELQAIFNAENISAIKTTKIKKDILHKIGEKHARRFKRSNNKVSEALVELLNPVSYLFLLIDASFTLIQSVTLTSFIIGGISFTALGLLVGAFHFIGTYKNLQRREEKEVMRDQLLVLQEACVNAYADKNNLKANAAFSKVSSTVKTATTNASALKEKNKWWQKIKIATETMILVSATLFYTYYAATLALSIAFSGSLLVGALMGSVGIGLALAVSFTVGIYLGYKKFQLSQTMSDLKQERSNLQDSVNEKITVINRTNVSHTKQLASEKKSKPLVLSFVEWKKSKGHKNNFVSNPVGFFKEALISGGGAKSPTLSPKVY